LYTLAVLTDGFLATITTTLTTTGTTKRILVPPLATTALVAPQELIVLDPTALAVPLEVIVLDPIALAVLLEAIALVAPPAEATALAALLEAIVLVAPLAVQVPAAVTAQDQPTTPFAECCKIRMDLRSMCSTKADC